MALTELALFIKIANFFIRARGMQSLLHTMRSFKLDSIEEDQLISKRLAFFKKIATYYYACANLAICTSVLTAILSSELKLPFYGWYILEWRNNRQNYWCIFAYQIIGMIITANVNITIELFPMLLMYMASVQIEILGRRMKVVGWTRGTLAAAVDNNGYSHDDIINQDGLSEIHSQLIKSVETHKDICK